MSSTSQTAGSPPRRADTPGDDGVDDSVDTNLGTRPAHTREVMRGAWYLTRRNLGLAVMHFVSGMVTSGLALGAVLVVFVALLIPATRWDLGSLGGVAGYLVDVVERIGRREFVVPLVGIGFVTFASVLAVTAWVQAAVYGRIAHGLAPDGRRATFIGCGNRWFASMVGYQALRLVFDLLAAGFAVVAFVWPLLHALFAIEVGHDALYWVTLSILGATASALFVGLLTLWRLAALGPLLFEGRSVTGAYTAALVGIGRRFGAWVNLGLGLCLVLLPALLVYLAFTALFSFMSAAPNLAMLGFLFQSTLDLAWGVVLAVGFVFAGACVLLNHAWLTGLIPALPTRRTAPRSVSGGAVSGPGTNQSLRFGDPIRFPGASPLVVMPLPAEHPNVVPFADVLPPLEPDQRPAPQPEAAAAPPAEDPDTPGREHAPADATVGEDPPERRAAAAVPPASDMEESDGLALEEPPSGAVLAPPATAPETDPASDEDDDAPVEVSAFAALPSLDLAALTDVEPDLFETEEVADVEVSAFGELEVADVAALPEATPADGEDDVLLTVDADPLDDGWLSAIDDLDFGDDDDEEPS